MGRRFSSAMRNAILGENFDRHGQIVCEECGSPLGEDWHADHVIPWSRGGPTTTDNGRALCPACNLRKGAKMPPTAVAPPATGFEPRKWQRELVKVTRRKAKEGERRVFGQIATGAGKTVGAQLVATELFRMDRIERTLVLVPRQTLREQFEMDWQVIRRSIPDPRPDEFRAISNHKRATLLSPDGPHGCVKTYQSVTVEPDGVRQFADAYEGRFLLVLDEVHFLGLADDEDDGPAIAQLIGELVMPHAAMTLLMSGSPIRADDLPIIGAEYDKDVDEEGRRMLRPDVKFTYRDGIAAGFLRPFVIEHREGEVILRNSDTDERFKVELNEKTNLGKYVQSRQVWEPLVDRTLEHLAVERRKYGGFRALIACANQDHARSVREYVREQGANPTLVISDEAGAGRQLQGFVEDRSQDVLVTVDMASIGFDCKDITIVCVLSNKRTHPWLIQTVGRGSRVQDCAGAPPAGQQRLRVLGPNDEKFKAFRRWMQEETAAGLQEREIRSRAPRGDGSGDDWVSPFVQEEGFLTGDATFHGVDSIYDTDNEKVAEWRSVFEENNIDMSGASEIDVSRIVHALRTGERATQPGPEFTPEPESDEQFCRRMSNRQKDQITGRLKDDLGIPYRGPGDDTWRKCLAIISAEATNRVDGCKNTGDFIHRDQWHRREAAIERLFDSGWARRKLEEYLQ